MTRHEAPHVLHQPLDGRTTRFQDETEGPDVQDRDRVRPQARGEDVGQGQPGGRRPVEVEPIRRAATLIEAGVGGRRRVVGRDDMGKVDAVDGELVAQPPTGWIRGRAADERRGDALADNGPSGVVRPATGDLGDTAAGPRHAVDQGLTGDDDAGHGGCIADADRAAGRRVAARADPYPCPMRRLSDVDELLDGPLDDPAVLRGNLHDLARVNRRLGGAALSIRAVDALAGDRSSLDVVDVGTGAADIPVALLGHAARHRPKLARDRRRQPTGDPRRGGCR